MFNPTSPLVKTEEARRATFEVGDLVTVKLYGDKVSGAKVERIAHNNVFVKLVGLEVPSPYAIGDRFPLDTDKVIDW